MHIQTNAPERTMQLVEPTNPAMAERHRRDSLRDRAAWALYESLRLPTQPEWDQLSSRDRNRVRNASAIGAASLDMTRIAREGK